MKESYIMSVLKRSFEEGLMVSVYSNRYQPEKSSVGFIDSLTTEQFVMKHVTPEGISDGYIIRRIEDVFRVDVSGEYERRLELLYSIQKQQHEDFIKILAMQNLNLFKESLSIAQKKNLVVTICVDETENQDDIIGFVKDVCAKEITISRITYSGLEDGESTVFIEDVIKMNCDTTGEKTFKLLFNHQKGNNV
ncbi:hypothetical protein [Hazenella coriacea]|uniref:Uncharacterized protein n=1 Tax=Hazenella coriacea TaxID=1179467 RepID=A0A4R3KZN9_9BACL|nr:hypothetical protein [Hazenella coriacea]TCS92077.1 hypothetical protein EDD58_1184 [Hazenella coriacea]